MTAAAPESPRDERAAGARRPGAAPARLGFGRRPIGAPFAMLAVAAFIVALDNGTFWSAALEATRPDESRAGILLSLGALLFCTTLFVLSLAVGRWTLKIVGAALLIVAAVCSHFMGEYGIVIDSSMIRNIAETQVQEASPLLTASLYWHTAVFGILPALVLLAAPLRSASWPRELGARAAIAVASVLAAAGIIYANYGAVAYFVRQHHSVRLFLNPGYPIYSLFSYVLRDRDTVPTVRTPLDARVAAARGDRPKATLVVLVAGETARADRFSFNGYERDTNRYTRPLGVVNFPQVTSCGTSTAESVPCIFSGLGREEFTHAAAAEREPLFGTLNRLGARVFWRDNSTGCKDVCEPAQFEEFAARTDADLCDATGCFDEILLKGIDDLVADSGTDHFIVLHQRGSHGPAYHTDTPQWSKEFLPECDSPTPRNCDLELINNAYDNTILYSDYFLSRVIEFLQRHDADYDVAMLYVSDHGESLGENGLYLHGFPYAIAPTEQTHVPMLFWASPSFYAANSIDLGCVREQAEREISHDWIYHTLLPLFGLETPSYRKDLDVFAACRTRGGARPSGRQSAESAESAVRGRPAP